MESALAYPAMESLPSVAVRTFALTVVLFQLVPSANWMVSTV